MISDKIDFKTRNIAREKKRIFYDKGINIPGRYNNYKYIHRSNNRHPNYMKQKWTELKEVE